MVLFNDEFLTVTLDDTKTTIINTWAPTTEDMTDEEYQSHLLKFTELAKVHKPTYHLIRSVDFLYTITNEMQEWTNTEVFPGLIEAGITKIAFLVSSEIMAQLSIELALDESNASSFQVQYFDTENDAMAWISK